MKPRHFALLRAIGAFFVAAGTLATPALAQDYPARQIRLVVPFPAGSGTDTISRLMQDETTRSTRAKRVFAYKGQPPAMTDLMGGQTHSIMADLAAISVAGEPNTAEDFNARVRTQLRVWGQRIRKAGIKPE